MVSTKQPPHSFLTRGQQYSCWLMDKLLLLPWVHHEWGTLRLKAILWLELPVRKWLCWYRTQELQLRWMGITPSKDSLLCSAWTPNEKHRRVEDSVAILSKSDMVLGVVVLSCKHSEPVKVSCIIAQFSNKHEGFQTTLFEAIMEQSPDCFPTLCIFNLTSFKAYQLLTTLFQ